MLKLISGSHLGVSDSVGLDGAENVHFSNKFSVVLMLLV